MNSNVKLHHELAAHLLDVGSAVGHAKPRLGALIGKKDAPSQLAAHWRYSGRSADSMASWVEFDGDPAAGRIPRRYKLAALVAIDKEILDDYQRRLGGHQAVVYALGTAVMVGTVENPNFLGDDITDSGRYAVGMAIGRGTLRTAIGIRGEDGRTVVPPLGLHGGLVTPVRDWPPSIPLL